MSSPNVSHDESLAKELSLKESGLAHRPKRRRFHESYNFNMKCPTPGCNSLGNWILIVKNIYTSIQKFGGRFVVVFEKKSLLCSPRLHLFDQKYSKNSKIVIMIKNNCILFSFIAIYSCDGKSEFSSAITPVFCVT